MAAGALGWACMNTAENSTLVIENGDGLKVLKVGDLVRHKAGGPLMAISRIDADGVWCQWFRETEPRMDRFEEAVLAIASTPAERLAVAVAKMTQAAALVRQASTLTHEAGKIIGDGPLVADDPLWEAALNELGQIVSDLREACSA